MKNLEIKNESGRSMIEMLGVLAIIGVLSVGGIAGYSKAMQKYRINKTIEQITLIAGNVRTFFASQRSYGDLYVNDSYNYTLIKKAKLVPDEMWNSAGTNLENIFGDGVKIFPETKEISGDNRAFQLYYMSVPSEACIELATYDWTAANGGVICFNGASKDVCRKTPVDVNDAVALCSSNEGDPLDMNFYFDVNTSGTYWINIFK